MTTRDDRLPAILRRRAKELSAEYSDQFVGAIERAARELEVRQRCTDPDSSEAEAVNLAFENARLRKVLREMYAAIKSSTMERARRDHCLELISRVAKSAKGPRRDRKFLAVEVLPGWTRVEIEAAVSTQLDSLFGGTDGEAQAASDPEAEAADDRTAAEKTGT